jgi:hypothetical protein
LNQLHRSLLTINDHQANWAQVAIDAGFKDANIAKVRFSQIRKKYGWNVADEAASATPGSGGAMSGTPGNGDSMVDDSGIPSFSTPTAQAMSMTPSTGSGVKGGKVRKPRTRKDSNTPTKPRKGSKAWLAAQAALLQMQGKDAGQAVDDAALQGGVKAEAKEEEDMDVDRILEEAKLEDANDEA